MAIDTAVVLVVTVLGAEDCRADRTSEVFNVIFSVESGNI